MFCMFMNVRKSTHYHIYLVIRRVFSFQNNPKNLDLSCKTDVDLWHCLGRVKLIIMAKYQVTDVIF